MRKTMMVVVIVLAMGVGCSTTKGRVSVFDLDFRTAEQIQAQTVEKTVIYGEPPFPLVASTSGISVVTPWSLIIDLLKVVKGRIMIGSVEWRVNEPTKE